MIEKVRIVIKSFGDVKWLSIVSISSLIIQVFLVFLVSPLGLFVLLDRSTSFISVNCVSATNVLYGLLKIKI